MSIFGSLFSRRKPVHAMYEAQVKQANAITSASVEADIDRAGRLAVFERARELGWSAAMPAPLWVWNAIAVEIILEKERVKATQERVGATHN